MLLARVIQTLLTQQNIAYHLVVNPDSNTTHEAWLDKSIPAQNLAKVAMLKDGKGTILAVFPSSQQLNLATLKNILRRDLRFLDTEDQQKVCDGFLNHTSSQPGKAAVGFQIIIDEGISNQDHIYFSSTRPNRLFLVRGAELQHLSENTLIGSVFSTPRLAPQPRRKDDLHQRDLRARVAAIKELPPMPEIASHLLRLRQDPNASVEQLEKVIAKDPSLAAQVIRYANSALFGQKGQVKSIKDAVFRVLGFETVLYLALGTCMGKAFVLPDEGPLGRTAFWKNATYCAALCQKLASCMPVSKRPQASVAYLAGLLHNIGFLVLAKLFKDEFNWLNKMVAARTDVPVTVIEKDLLGIDHTELGGWLMQAWQIPREITLSVARHHNESYVGEHGIYVKLVQLSDRLLKMHNMSDAESDELPDYLIEQLGLSEEQIFHIMDDVLQGSDTLNAMAMALTA